MFSKPANTTRKDTHDAGAPAPARKSLPASLVADNVTIKGDVVSDGDVHLDGVVQGDIRVSHLTVGDTGEVRGSIDADIVDVRGRVTGSISARQVRLFGTAKVEGDITHTELAVDAGASFQGRSVRFEAAPPELSVVVTAAE